MLSLMIPFSSFASLTVFIFSVFSYLITRAFDVNYACGLDVPSVLYDDELLLLFLLVENCLILKTLKMDPLDDVIFGSVCLVIC